MKIVFFAVFLFEAAKAQTSEFSQFSCNGCFGPKVCFNDDDNLPAACITCLQSSCESQLGLAVLVTGGVPCIAAAWQDPGMCASQCPTWTYWHSFRAHFCQQCLTPCVAEILATGAGECVTEIPAATDVCTPQDTRPCGSCFRSNLCFTQEELAGFGGICQGYLTLRCPDPFDISCIDEAFQDSCSTCPVNVQNLGRLEECSLCVSDCTTKRDCLDACRNMLPTYPTGVPCPLCRAFCDVGADPSQCKTTYCDCDACDLCATACNNLPGGDFNLFNPCMCLNREEDSIVMRSEGGRIIGGSDVCEGNFPFVALIYTVAGGPDNGPVCGGTLINDRWVLTAAHCFGTPDEDLFMVALGEYDRTAISNREQFFSLSQLHRHPGYNSLTYAFDAALVELSQAVTITEYVSPIPNIATIGQRIDNNEEPALVGDICTTVGWGEIATGTETFNAILRQLYLRIISISFCEDDTVSAMYAQGSVVEGDPKFCAGNVAGEDSCNGDSGGPLFCRQEDGSYILLGITSYGTEPCAVGLPGVYTKVSDIRSWIDGIIQ